MYVTLSQCHASGIAKEGSPSREASVYPLKAIYKSCNDPNNVIMASPRAHQEAGASWKDKETHEIPKNPLALVFLGLMLCIFLAALDQTIVATALPTIVAELGGGNGYSWVGSSYLLAAASLSPLYGKLSDLVGRKPVLFTSVIIFLVGSALSGAAQNINWLIGCRAVQGIGGGGMIQIVVITISDIVTLQEYVLPSSLPSLLFLFEFSRAKYGGLIGATWGIARSFLSLSTHSRFYINSFQCRWPPARWCSHRSCLMEMVLLHQLVSPSLVSTYSSHIALQTNRRCRNRNPLLLPQIKPSQG